GGLPGRTCDGAGGQGTGTPASRRVYAALAPATSSSISCLTLPRPVSASSSAMGSSPGESNEAGMSGRLTTSCWPGSVRSRTDSDDVGEALCEAGVAQVPDGRRADEQLPGGGQGALVRARPALVEGPVEQLREPLRRERLRADDLEPQGERGVDLPDPVV